MLDQLHDDDLSLDSQNHLVGFDVCIAQTHSACVDQRSRDDLDRSALTGLIVDSETHTTRSTLTDELVESPVADVLGIVVIALLLPLQT